LTDNYDAFQVLKTTWTSYGHAIFWRELIITRRTKSNDGLNRACFDYGNRRGGWNDSCNLETAVSQEITVLILGSFQSLRRKQHHENVEILRMGRIVAFGHNHLDDQETASGWNRAADVLEDANGSVIGPVMNDVAQEVCVGAARNRFEEVSALEFSTFGQAGSIDVRMRAFDHMLLIEEQAAQCGIPFHRRRQHASIAATNVGERRHACEIVCIQHGLGLSGVKAVHRRVEKFGLLG